MRSLVFCSKSIFQTHPSPQGRVEAYDENIRPYDTPWQSWVNLARIRGTYPNADYAAGYICAHEILHQFIAFGSMHKYGNIHAFAKHSGGDWGENLNMDGEIVHIPAGPRKELQTAERILPIHSGLLFEVFDFKR